MSMLQLIVNESTRKLSNRISNQVFVVNDANVDTIRFSIPAGFSDIDIDENASFRVMYIPPGIDKTVYAKTLTFVQNDGVYISYDWQVGPNVLVESGILTVSFCILKTGSEVQEWHTIPYTIPVSNTIHTDDSDEADETITPTVAQRVAVLESVIQGMAGGAPVVVGSVSDMTDTDKLYVLSTDGKWYYHNGTAWTVGGEYGAVATDTTLTQSRAAADAKAVGDKITDLKVDLSDENGVVIRSNDLSESVGFYKKTTYHGSLVNFTNGYVRNDGTWGGDSQRLHSTFVAGDGKTWNIQMASGFVVELVAEYASAEHSSFVKNIFKDITDGYTSKTITMESGKYYVFQIRKTPIANISRSDVTETTIVLSNYIAKSLCKDMMDELSFVDEISFAWGQGYIISTSGEISGDNVSCYTYYEKSDGFDITVSVASGYKHKIAEYNNNKGFIQIISALTASSVTVNIENGHYYRIQVTKDSGTLSPTNVPNVVSVTRKYYTDASLTKKNKAADAYSTGAHLFTKIIELENGTYTSQGYRYNPSRNDFLLYKINKYPLLLGDAEELSINATCTVIFRNSTGGSVSSYNEVEDYKISIPSNSYYADIEILATNIPERGLMVTLWGCTHGLEKTKRIYRNSGDRIISMFMVDETTEMFTFSNLLLPPNYDGLKNVPCILWLDGSGAVQWGNSFSGPKVPYLEYLRDEGFAVFSVYSWGNNYIAKYPDCGSAMPYPVPTNLACIKKCIEYLTDRYAIDKDNIHVMSKSQGGQCALYFASRPIWNFKSIGMFAPVLDYLSMPGEAMYADVRKALVDDLGLTGNTSYFTSTSFVGYSDEAIAFWNENYIQNIGFNEAYTDLIGASALENLNKSLADCKKFWTEEGWTTPDRTDIYNHPEYKKLAKIPVKIWGASDDNNTPYFKMPEVVSQLQNGGTEAVMRTFERGTGGHNCADLGDNVIASVTTSLGITHTNVPTGWVENVEWIRLHSPK